MKNDAKTSAPATVDIVYVGPAGQVSPVFGSLGVGSRYQAPPDFAEYVLAKHPDYWQRPPAKASA